MQKHSSLICQKWRLGNRDVKAQYESHTAQEKQSWDSNPHLSFRKPLWFENIDRECTALFALLPNWIGYTVGLDGRLPFLHTKNLLKAYIHSYIPFQLALVLWVACGIGMALSCSRIWGPELCWVCLEPSPPESWFGASGARSASSDLTLVAWIAHDGSVYIMETGKAWKSDLHSSLQRACFQHISAQDSAQKGHRELMKGGRAVSQGSCAPYCEWQRGSVCPVPWW